LLLLPLLQRRHRHLLLQGRQGSAAAGQVGCQGQRLLQLLLLL
jgi:hypothetical protein